MHLSVVNECVINKQHCRAAQHNRIYALRWYIIMIIKMRLKKLQSHEAPLRYRIVRLLRFFRAKELPACIHFTLSCLASVQWWITYDDYRCFPLALALSPMWVAKLPGEWKSKVTRPVWRVEFSSSRIKSSIKDVRANCLCASLLRR